MGRMIETDSERRISDLDKRVLALENAKPPTVARTAQAKPSAVRRPSIFGE